MTLTEEIKRKALDLGFSKVGVARAEPLEREAALLAQWLARGYHGTMEWMARNFEKRIDPQKVLPGARSVVVVAMNYYTKISHSGDERVGKVSRYAWGDDYHDVVLKKLAALLGFIRSKDETAEGKIYVDTGPMLEKLWAQRAGLGWEGKHTNLITQEYGSWVFLGEIILSIPLDYDEPATDHCGSCTLCIEACPTHAIVEPYLLDSNLCISYLTIEHRGKIARELGEKFDRWLYGCDTCQDVCPWNKKFAEPTAMQEFLPREHNVAPDPEAWVRMEEEEFIHNYRNSPMKRTKLAGLVRNAKVFLEMHLQRKKESHHVHEPS